MKKKEVASIRRVPSWFRVRSVATLVLAVAASGAILPTAHADLITAFDFDKGATTGTANAATLASTSGQPSNITTNFAATNVMVFGGTTVNAVDTVTPNYALGLQGGTGAVAGGTGGNNGDSIFFSIVGTGLSNLDVSYATQATSTGFKTQALSYSLNSGGPYTLFDTRTNLPTTFVAEEFNLTSVTALNNQANVYFELTFTGATATAGNNRIDNLVVSMVPEPTTILGGLLLLVGAGWSQRRRLAAALGLAA